MVSCGVLDTWCGEREPCEPSDRRVITSAFVLRLSHTTLDKGVQGAGHWGHSRGREGAAAGWPKPEVQLSVDRVSLLRASGRLGSRRARRLQGRLTKSPQGSLLGRQDYLVTYSNIMHRAVGLNVAVYWGHGQGWTGCHLSLPWPRC